MHVAIVGAGYAGMAAAAELAARGVRVTVFEASQTLGGRARRIEVHGEPLDNGPHILVGAYTELMRLMRLVGAAPEDHLDRRPLTLCYPGRFRLAVPPLPAPFNLAAALLTSRGLALRERLAALRFMRALRRQGFRLERDMPFTELMARQRQPDAVVRYLWMPLCISALNTPAEEASAQVFLNVLRDSLAGRSQASDLLFARSDFSALFPEPAERFLRARGGELWRGTTIRAIERDAHGFRLEGDPLARHYTHVIAAVAPYRLRALGARLPCLQPTLAQVGRLDYEPILTAYLAYPRPVPLAAAMTGIGGTAHFLFRRTPRIVAAVTSARGPHLELPRAALVARIHAEVEGVAGPLPPPQWSRLIVEKRATFSCRPGLERPPCETPLPDFFLAGDYVASDYPATLEAAVRSGVACARLITRQAGRC